MSSKAQERYKIQKEKFIAEHKNKDDDYDFKFRDMTDWSEDYHTIVNPKRGGYPWYTNDNYLCLLDIFLLGWIQRLIFDIKSVRVEFTIEKRIIE